MFSPDFLSKKADVTEDVVLSSAEAHPSWRANARRPVRSSPVLRAGSRKLGIPSETARTGELGIIGPLTF